MFKIIAIFFFSNFFSKANRTVTRLITEKLTEAKEKEEQLFYKVG